MNTRFKQSSLAFLLIFTLCIIPAKAANWNDLGNYNISWYSTSSDLYVSTPEEVAGIAYLINNKFTDFYGQTIHFTANIDLAGKNWIPIGIERTFRGSIKGHGHTISSLFIDDTESISAFIGNMSGGEISNLTLLGKIQTSKPKSALLVFSATSCVFLDLNISGNITYVNTSSLGSTGAHLDLYQGGVVAIAKYCKFTDIYSTFSQSLSYGKSNGSSMYGYITLKAGGIVADGTENTYLRCETSTDFENTIYGYIASSAYSITQSTNITCGGIAGYESSKSTMTACLSRISNYKGYHNTGTYDSVRFNLYGFGYFSGKAQNSVAIIDSYTINGHNYSWVASWYHTSALISDCGEYNSSSIVGGCYVNSDITGSTSKLSNETVKIHSSQAFSKNQMNTRNFIDEMNLYCILHMSGAQNWDIKNDKLSLKHESYDYSGMNDVEYNFTNSDEIHYYKLNGIEIKEPLPRGIYIRKEGSKVSKVIIQ